MIKLVAFDWNGTLFADTKPIVDADNVVLEKLGLAPITVSHFRNIFTIPLIEYYAGCGVDRAKYLKHQHEIEEWFHEAYEQRVKHVRTRSGVRKLLHWLDERKIVPIIFSNHTNEGIHFQLNRLGIGTFFQDVLARDLHNGPDEKRIKGAKLEAYLEANGYKKSDVVIVADGVEEIEIGKTLGIPCVALSGGYTSTIRLRGASPDFLIHSLIGLEKIIEKL